MSEPLLTVLMPVYNGEAHVKEAVESVLNQTFSEFKLLVVDDGCTDQSIPIIKNFNDSRIEVLTLPENKGLVNALNVGLKAISTTYIARTDADDICLPMRFEKQIEYMEAHPEIAALGTGFDSLMPNGEVKSGGRFSPDHNTIRLKHLYIIQIIHGTSMFRTALVKQHNLEFDPSFKHAEDYDFFDRLSSTSEIANIPEPLYLIRHHEQRVSEQFSHIQKANSDRVKIRILRQIGVDVTESDLELIQWMMYQNYGWFDKQKAQKLARLIGGICTANTTSKYLNPEFMRSELSIRFLHLCNFLAKENSGMTSVIKQNTAWKFADSPKLFASTFIKSMLA